MLQSAIESDQHLIRSLSPGIPSQSMVAMTTHSDGLYTFPHAVVLSHTQAMTHPTSTSSIINFPATTDPVNDSNECIDEQLDREVTGLTEMIIEPGKEREHRFHKEGNHSAKLRSKDVFRRPKDNSHFRKASNVPCKEAVDPSPFLDPSSVEIEVGREGEVSEEGETEHSNNDLQEYDEDEDDNEGEDEEDDATSENEHSEEEEQEQEEVEMNSKSSKSSRTDTPAGYDSDSSLCSLIGNKFHSNSVRHPILEPMYQREKNKVHKRRYVGQYNGSSHSFKKRYEEEEEYEEGEESYSDEGEDSYEEEGSEFFEEEGPEEDEDCSPHLSSVSREILVKAKSNYRQTPEKQNIEEEQGSRDFMQQQGSQIISEDHGYAESATPRVIVESIPEQQDISAPPCAVVQHNEVVSAETATELNQMEIQNEEVDTPVIATSKVNMEKEAITNHEVMDHKSKFSASTSLMSSTCLDVELIKTSKHDIECVSDLPRVVIISSSQRSQGSPSIVTVTSSSSSSIVSNSSVLSTLHKTPSFRSDVNRDIVTSNIQPLVTAESSVTGRLVRIKRTPQSPVQKPRKAIVIAPKPSTTQPPAQQQTCSMPPIVIPLPQFNKDSYTILVQTVTTTGASTNSQPLFITALPNTTSAPLQSNNHQSQQSQQPQQPPQQSQQSEAAKKIAMGSSSECTAAVPMKKISPAHNDGIETINHNAIINQNSIQENIVGSSRAPQETIIDSGM